MSTETLKRSSSNGSADDHTAKKSKANHHENGKSSTELSHDVPSRIHYTTIFSSDLAKSEKYYEEVLGFKKSVAGSVDGVWIEMKSSQSDKLIGSTTLSFHHIGDKEKKCYQPGEIELGFFVKNIDKFHEAVSSRSDTVVVKKPTKESWGGTSAEYKGPDNVKYVIIESASFDPDAPKTDTKKTETAEQKTESVGSGICHFELPCADMKRAQKFYTDLFGWTFTTFDEENVMFDTHNTEFKLAGGLILEKDSTKRIHYPANYLVVKDIDAALKDIKVHGGEALSGKIAIPGGHGFRASFKDCEGNAMALYQKP